MAPVRSVCSVADAVMPPPRTGAERLTLSTRLLRLDDRAPAVGGSAATRVEGEIFGCVLVEVLVLVIVRQLGTGRYALDRFDPDATALDVRVTVRITRVVDEARIVAVEGGVDDPPAVQREQKRVVPLIPLVGIPAIRFRVADRFTGILDDACAVRDVLSREGAEPLNGRLAQLEPLVVIDRRRRRPM